ncbi:hypothetical protein SGPA1_20483 [Streptomyces misionensis JCM 4497]
MAGRRTGRRAHRRARVLAGRPGGVPDRVQLHLRVGAGPRGRADPPCRGGPQRADVRHRPAVPSGGPAERADGGVHAPGAAQAAGRGDQGEQPAAGRARRSGALRGPGRPRHRRPRPAGLRRPGDRRGGRDPGVLGLRGDPSGGRDGLPAAVRHHARAGSDVPDRRARRAVPAGRHRLTIG